MTYVVYRPNPLDRNEDSTKFVGPCLTVRKALEARFPGFVEFPTPTVVVVGGVPQMRATWDAPLAPSAVVEVVAVPGAVVPAIMTAVAIASLFVSAYAVYKMNSLPSIADAVGGTVPEKASSFTFEGQKNVTRLNNVLEVGYGRCRWWPAYLCAPRVEYVNNKPILKMWLSLGKGNYAIEDVRVNDTSFSTISKASFVQFDSDSVLSSENSADLVYYAEDFSGTELTGTNEEEHGVIGPYALNPANTNVEDLFVNFSYPSGLCTLDANGVLQDATCTVLLDIHELSPNGTPTGVVIPWTVTHTKKTASPLRITERLSITALGLTSSRIAVSAVRTNQKNTTTGGQDSCSLEAVYATGHSLRAYKSSLLYVELPGTAIVGQDASEKVNVVATRKLRTRSGGAWTGLVATRNPIHAVVDILQAEYGAGRTDGSLDLDYWEALASDCSSVNFDYRFEQKTTVWDALTAVATVLRGKPYRVGSDVRIFVDSPVQTPVCVFTPDNTADLKVQMSFIGSAENDCIEAAYIDADTGLQDSVYFTPPGSSATNPTKIVFAGVADRETAWRLAAYTYLQRTLLRDRVSFSTGLEGKIPLLGEVILVSWPLPSWDSAGVVLAYDGASRLELSEAVPHSAGWLSLRRHDGSAWGPVKFTYAGELSAESYPAVTLECAPDSALDFTAGSRDPVAYTLGTETVTTRKFQVTNVTPSQDSVQIEGTEFNPAVFGYDNLSVPERGDDMLPYPSVIGKTPWLRVLEESGQYLRVEAGPVYGNPTSITCSYAYVLESVLTAAVIAAPWAYIGAGLAYETAEADNYGASYYIPRQAGVEELGVLVDPYVLFVRLDVAVAGTTYTTWWRSRPGKFEGDELRVSHASLVNNCDVSYIAPGNPGNEASPASEGTSKGAFIPSAILDVNEAKIVVTTDCPPGGSAEIRVESGTQVGEVFNVEHSVAKRIKDAGPVTFTAEDIALAGIQGTTTSYPALRIVADHTIDGDTGNAPVVVPISVYPLVSDPIEQTCTQEPLSRTHYVVTEWYYEVPGEPPTTTYVQFSDNLTQQYLVSLIDGFTGSVETVVTLRSQTTTNMTSAPVVRTLSTPTGRLIVDKFRYPHIDQLSVISVVGLYSQYLRISGCLHIGNLSFAEASTEAKWSCVLLDANFDRLPCGRLDYDANAVRVEVRNNQGKQVAFNQSPVDSQASFYLRLWNNLTAEDLTYFSNNLRYVVFINTAPFKDPSVSTAGWGAVELTMVDMFGRYGNTTPASLPSLP